jgi:hypothetical protein
MFEPLSPEFIQVKLPTRLQILSPQHTSSMFEPLSPELIQVELPNSPRRDPLLHGKIEAVNPNRQGA